MSGYRTANEGQIPVLVLGKVLLVTLPAELHDDMAATVQQDIAATVERSGARGVVIDISSVQIVDSFLGRVLADTAATVSLMAAETIVAGMHPAVAITLVELGLTLPGLRTALTAGEALARLTPGVAPGAGRGEA